MIYDRYKNNQLNDQFQNFQKSTLKEENISTRGKKCTVTLEREGNIVLAYERVHKIFFYVKYIWKSIINKKRINYIELTNKFVTFTQTHSFRLYPNQIHTPLHPLS